LAEARREIEIVAALKMALAHERKQHAAAESQELIEASQLGPQFAVCLP
jgi:hypothetical protein